MSDEFLDEAARVYMVDKLYQSGSSSGVGKSSEGGGEGSGGYTGFAGRRAPTASERNWNRFFDGLIIGIVVVSVLGALFVMWFVGAVLFGG